MIRKLLCFLTLHSGKVESEISDLSVKGYRIYFKCSYCEHRHYVIDF